MLEQDLALARLLLERTAELGLRAHEVVGRLRPAESRLLELQQICQEREPYEELLTKAAAMLGRTDLRVEIPDLDEDASTVRILRNELADIESESRQYKALLDELKQRAPQLISAASADEYIAELLERFDEMEALAAKEPDAAVEPQAGDEAASDAQNGHGANSADESSAADGAMQETADWQTGSVVTAQAEGAWQADGDFSEQAFDTHSDAEAQAAADLLAAHELEAGTPWELPDAALDGSFDYAGLARTNGHHDPSNSVVSENAFSREVAVTSEFTPDSSTDEPQAAEMDAVESGVRLARFNLRRLQEDADAANSLVYIVDATAVLERIPHYDRHRLALEEAAARDELVRDFDVLSQSIEAQYHLVFNSPHRPRVQHSSSLLVHGVVPVEHEQDAGVQIQELVAGAIVRDLDIRLVTSDPRLILAVEGLNVRTLSVGEFFLA